jgi:hypothetical protein
MPRCRVTFDSLSPRRERVRVRGIRIDILSFDTPQLAALRFIIEVRLSLLFSKCRIDQEAVYA